MYTLKKKTETTEVMKQVLETLLKSDLKINFYAIIVLNFLFKKKDK